MSIGKLFRNNIADREGRQSNIWGARRVKKIIDLHGGQIMYVVQCSLDTATLDIAAALPIATSNPVTDLRHYINSNFVYNDLKI